MEYRMSKVFHLSKKKTETDKCQASIHFSHSNLLPLIKLKTLMIIYCYYGFRGKTYEYVVYSTLKAFSEGFFFFKSPKLIQACYIYTYIKQIYINIYIYNRNDLA